MLQATRADRERTGFADVEKWSAKKLGVWISKLEGGKYANLAFCFSRCSGTMTCIEPQLLPTFELQPEPPSPF